VQRPSQFRHLGAPDSAGGCELLPRGATQVTLQPLKADRLTFEHRPVEAIILDQEFDEAEGEGGIPARLDRNKSVGGPAGGVAVRIDDQQAAALLPRLGDQRPEMDIGHLDVDAPGDDKLGIDRHLRRASRCRAAMPGPGGAGGGEADGLIQPQGPEAIKKHGRQSG